MSAVEFRECLQHLAISQIEAATLLSVNPRTVRRWAENHTEIPGPTEQVLRAWIRLQNLGFPWLPDDVSVCGSAPEEIAEAIAAYREKSLDLYSILEKVESRGGPAAPWDVNLKKCQATLGPISVSFYRLKNGGFSPSFYRRNDIKADRERDRILLEDAFACIAKAISNER